MWISNNGIFGLGTQKFLELEMLYCLMSIESMWPDDGIKNCPIFPNIVQKVAKPFLHESCIIKSSPNIYHNFNGN